MLSSAAWPPSAIAVDTARLTAVAWEGRGDTDARLALARSVASGTAPLGPGTAGAMFVTLAAIARADVTTARVVEPHLDATSILAQAHVEADLDATWGVFAAEAPGVRLDARPDGDGGHVLTGTKPWCSLASSLTHALVTAHLDDAGTRGLFAVDLAHPGVTTHDDAWIARGMPDVPSAPVDLDGVPGVPVGAPGWYLTRPGFAWGGIGVAACWWGGALGLATALRAAAVRDPGSDLLRSALGATVLDLADAEDAIAGAAARIDAPVRGAEPDPGLLAQVVRSRVARAVHAVRDRVVRTLGPAPMTTDQGYAARVADLELYLLQDHGERDVARIGRILLDRGGVAW